MRQMMIALLAVSLLAGTAAVRAAEPVAFPRTTIDLGTVVSDLEKSVRFYTEGIGFRELKGFDVSADLAAAAGLTSYVLIPANLERSKIVGSLVYGTQVIGIEGAYDQVNRLCSEIAGKYGWGFVNVNLRPYYAEGSKTMGFEIAEQLGWKLPRHTVACMASGSLLTKIHKAYKEFIDLGIVEKSDFTIHGAQATGCSPISAAFKAGTDIVKPVQNPDTIAKSLAIGTPADGYYAIRSMRETGGSCEDATDAEIVEGIKLLAEYAGIFAETAGGVTVACAKKLIESGKIPKNESAVLCITGHGLKTQEAIVGKVGEPRVIGPSLHEFEALVADEVSIKS